MLKVQTQVARKDLSRVWLVNPRGRVVDVEAYKAEDLVRRERYGYANEAEIEAAELLVKGSTQKVEAKEVEVEVEAPSYREMQAIAKKNDVSPVQKKEALETELKEKDLI